MTREQWSDVWRWAMRGLVVIASLATAGFHFFLVWWAKGMMAMGQAYPKTSMYYWLDYFGYGVLATTILLLPWLQPWTGYCALVIAAMALAFGIYGLFPEGIGLAYIAYAVVVAVGFWKLVGSKRFARHERRRGFPLD